MTHAVRYVSISTVADGCCFWGATLLSFASPAPWFCFQRPLSIADPSLQMMTG